MRRSSESSDPRKRSLHRRVSLLRRSEVGNASGSGSILDDDTDADWNEIEPQWWERLDRGPDKRASANYLPVNRSNTHNYSEILVEESRTIRISVVEDEHSDDSTFDSMGSLPTMSPMAFTKKKGLFQNNLKKKTGGTTPKPLLALPAPEIPSAPPVQQNKTVATDSDADSYLESLNFHTKINVDPQEERNMRVRNKNLFKNKKKNNHMTFSKAVDASSKVENNSGSINENQSIPVLKKPNLSQKQSKKLFKKNTKPRNSLYADALSHLESDGSLKGDEDLESNEVNKPAEVENISKHQETLKRRTSGRVSFSQRRLSDAESVKSGFQEYSPSSVVSETINFDRWKQLASSTMLDTDKSPKTLNKSNFKGSKQSLSDKLAVLHSDIVEEMEMSPAASESQHLQPNVEIITELPPALENLPKTYSKNSPATRRSDRLSKNSPVRRKSTGFQSTPDLVRNVVNKNYSEAYLEDAIGISKINEMNKTGDPALPRDERVPILSKGSQRQSIGTWLRLEESDEEISPPLSQSDVDRQVIEEMMAKRTNPPVRRSAHFSKQNIQDMSDSDGEMNQTHESINANIQGGDADQVSIEKLNASTEKQLATDKHQFEEKSVSRNKSVSILTENDNLPRKLPIAQSRVEENKSISHTEEQVKNLQILNVAEKSELESSIRIITDIGSELRKSQPLTKENFDSSNISLNRSRKIQNSSQQSAKDNHPDLSRNKSASHSTDNENVPETLPVNQSNAEENNISMINSQEQFENLQLLDTADKILLKKNNESEILDPNTNKIPIITSPHGSTESPKSQILTTENSDSSNISLNRSIKLQNSSQQSAKHNHPDFSRNKSVSHSTGNENVPETLPIDRPNAEENKSMSNSQEQFVNLQLLNTDISLTEERVKNLQILNVAEKSDLESSIRIITDKGSELRKSQSLTKENFDSSNISLNRSRKIQNSSQQSTKDNHPDLSQNKSASHSTGNENAPETLPVNQSNAEENKISMSNSQEQFENLQLDSADKIQTKKNIESDILDPNTNKIPIISSTHGSPISSESRKSQKRTTENSDTSNISLNLSRKLQISSQQSVKDKNTDLSRNESVLTLTENENVHEVLPIDQSIIEENKSIRNSQQQVENVQILNVAEKGELNKTEILESNTDIENITPRHGSPKRSKLPRSQMPNTENIASSLNQLRKSQSSSQQSVKDNHSDLSENKSVSSLVENENLPENLLIDQLNVKENKSISVTQKPVNNAEKSELKIIVESEILDPSTGINSGITSPHGPPIGSDSPKSQTLTTENPDSSNSSENRLKLKQNSSQKSAQNNHPDWLDEKLLKIVAPETMSSNSRAHYSDYPNTSADTSRNTFNSTLRNASAKDIWKDSVEEQVTPLKRMTPDVGIPTQKQVPDIEDSDLSANNSVDRSRKILSSLKRRATDIWQDSEEDQATLTPMKTMASTIHFEDNSISLLTPGPSKSIHRASVPAKRKFTEEELKEFAEKVMSENAKQAKIVEERFANRFTFQPYLCIPKAVQIKQKPMSKLLNVPRKPRVVKPKNTEEKVSKKLYMKEEWITKKLYNFVEKKLKPQYGLKSLLRTEKFIKDLAGVVNIVLKSKGGHHHYVDTLKREMARLQLVTTYFDFCCFIHEYLPFSFRIKSIAAEGRDVPEFTGKVFEPILNGKKKKQRH